VNSKGPIRREKKEYSLLLSSAFVLVLSESVLPGQGTDVLSLPNWHFSRRLITTPWLSVGIFPSPSSSHFQKLNLQSDSRYLGVVFTSGLTRNSGKTQCLFCPNCSDLEIFQWLILLGRREDSLIRKETGSQI